METRHILVVEDNKADIFLISEAVSFHKLQVELHIVHDGRLAIEFIDQSGVSGPRPSLCLLDLNVPIRTDMRFFNTCAVMRGGGKFRCSS